MPGILTIGLSNWAIDLQGAGAIYPFQGAEWLFVIFAVVFWIGFHVLQMRQEDRQWEQHSTAATEIDHARASIDRY